MMVAATEGSMPENDSLDLKTLISVLWKKKAIVLACVITFLAFGLFQVASTFPVYQADTLIQLEQRSGSPVVFETSALFGGGAVAASTEMQIISSRMVLGRAVAQQDLDKRVEPKRAPLVGNILARYDLPIPEWEFLAPYVRRGEALTVGELRVPPDWVGRQIIVTTTNDGYSAALPDGSVHEGRVGNDLILPKTGFLINVTGQPKAVGRQYTVRQLPERQAIGTLQSRLSIEEQGRGSGILKLRLTGHDIRDVETTLAAISDAYVQQNIQRSVAQAEGSIEFIQSQLPAAEQRVKDAQLALNRFKEETSDRAISQEWLGNESEQSFETQALLNQITRLESDLSRARQQVEQNQARYDESHPMVRKSLSDRGKIEMELAELLALVSELPEVQREIVNLTRDVELAQQIYLDLQTRYQEYQVLQASSVGSVRIVDPASSSLGAISPKKNIVILVWIFAGLLAGTALVLIQYVTRRGVSGSRDLERIGLPVFATIPKVNHRRERSRVSILALDKSDDVAIEALRSLRTSLYFGMIDSATKAITVTSSAPGAGKTTTSVNLAVVAAQSGQKIALIDADLRRGQLHKYFGIQRTETGLSDVLANGCTLESGLKKTQVENLFVMPAGRYPPNPSELLMRAEMGSIIKKLGDAFDLIIIDAPPVLAVTDPVVLGRLTGTTLVIARHGVTPLGELEAAKRTFQAAGVNITGAVLNGFDPRYADPTEGKLGYDYQYSYKTAD